MYTTLSTLVKKLTTVLWFDRWFPFPAVMELMSKVVCDMMCFTWIATEAYVSSTCKYAGKTYRFRISNVGLTQTFNFRIQGHRLLLVETEGCYVAQTYYTSLDVHLGQSYSVLVTMDQSIPADFHIVASTRFGWNKLFGLAVLHYNGSSRGFLSEDLPPAPTDGLSSLEQARSIRCLLSWPHPNFQLLNWSLAPPVQYFSSIVFKVYQVFYTWKFNSGDIKCSMESKWSEISGPDSI